MQADAIDFLLVLAVYGIAILVVYMAINVITYIITGHNAIRYFNRFFDWLLEDKGE